MAKDKNQKRNNKVMTIGVRDLLWAVHRKGGLRKVQFKQLSKNAGSRTHQSFYHRVYEDYRNFSIESEISLKYLWDDNTDTDAFIQGIEVQGRADLLFIPINDKRAISFHQFENSINESFFMEVKTLQASLDFVNPKGETMHWMQVRFYTFMYIEEQIQKHLISEEPDKVHYALAYVSQESLESKFLFQEESYADLKTWVEKTIFAYLHTARTLKYWKEARDESIREMRFPYKSLRDGQSIFIKQCFDSIQRTTPLLAEAPTGIGKTMSVLYPAVKTLPSRQYDHIFYLTAKNSTKKVAEDAAQDLRKKSNVKLKQITIQAKETICLCPELYCDTELCPYAKNYYDNLENALEALSLHEVYTSSLLLEAGQKFKLCPFELSLDLATRTDLIIADYNYAFDPRIRLERFFNESNERQILLVDEAHNLLDRSREMYSVTLELKDFTTLQQYLPSNSYIEKIWQRAIDYFLAIQKDIEGEAGLWASLERNEENEPIRVLAQENFRATQSALLELSTRFLPWLQSSRDLLDAFTEAKIKRKYIELIGQVKFFQKITEEFWSKSYIACARLHQGNLSLRLICLDVSERLNQSYMNTHASVFFSATLSPLSYFAIHFCGKHSDNRPDTLSLASPFPPENLEVYRLPFLSTTYNKRKASANQLAKAIALTILLKKGQQMFFFPSFAYMDMIVPLVQKILSAQDIRWLIQERKMTQKQRKQFLEAFETPSSTKTLASFVILGGIFGEGIDLIGEKLNGVSIIGVGLPQLSPERNIMREYYDEEYQAGFLHAYQYPGMNKVLQAAGRLIRSEEDKGFLLLIDERYQLPNYSTLLPNTWMIQDCHSLAELKDLLSKTRIQTKNNEMT